MAGGPSAIQKFMLMSALQNTPQMPGSLAGQQHVPTHSTLGKTHRMLYSDPEVQPPGVQPPAAQSQVAGFSQPIFGNS
jgi:hypothetical protein